MYLKLYMAQQDFIKCIQWDWYIYSSFVVNFGYFFCKILQFIQMPQIILVGTDFRFRLVFVWEKFTQAPWGNPPVWHCDHKTILHANDEYRAWVASEICCCMLLHCMGRTSYTIWILTVSFKFDCDESNWNKIFLNFKFSFHLQPVLKQLV